MPYAGTIGTPYFTSANTTNTFKALEVFFEEYYILKAKQVKKSIKYTSTKIADKLEELSKYLIRTQ